MKAEDGHVGLDRDGHAPVVAPDDHLGRERSDGLSRRHGHRHHQLLTGFHLDRIVRCYLVGSPRANWRGSIDKRWGLVRRQLGHRDRAGVRGAQGRAGRRDRIVGRCDRERQSTLLAEAEFPEIAACRAGLGWGLDLWSQR